MKHIIWMLLGGVLLMGCCGPSTASGFCPYGTYGESCTEFCEKSARAGFGGGPGCFSECMSIIKNQGLGDATTCCKENIRQGCRRNCQEHLDKIKTTYGADVWDNAEFGDFMNECVGECTVVYEKMGINIDSTCSLITTQLTDLY